jgi:hypothetical protein
VRRRASEDLGSSLSRGAPGAVRSGLLAGPVADRGGVSFKVKALHYGKPQPERVRFFGRVRSLRESQSRRAANALWCIQVGTRLDFSAGYQQWA